MATNHEWQEHSALLSFSAQNVRSYRDRVELSLIGTRMSDPKVVHNLRSGSGGRSVAVLPVDGVFGANASGKSTILKAMSDMRATVLSSFRQGTSSTPFDRRPFLLSPESKSMPSSYEIDLILNGVRWQYGFEANDKVVLEEYAYHYPNGRQTLVFDRDVDSISFGKLLKTDGRRLEPLLRANALLLSVVGAAGRSVLEPLFGWFETNFLLAESATRDSRALRTADLAQDSPSRERVLALLCAADLGITDISREPVPDDLRIHLQNSLLGNNEGLDDDQVRLYIEDHLRLTHCGQDSCVDLDSSDESIGTLVWVGLVGPVLDALDSGSVLLADELDASLHPHLVERIISLFQNPDTNPRCAQLIFNAHDVTVLGDSENHLLGRDQVWFTEKKHDGSTVLYPLTDFSPRKDESIERRYLQGRFGALPVLDTGEFIRATELVKG